MHHMLAQYMIKEGLHCYNERVVKGFECTELDVAAGEEV